MPINIHGKQYVTVAERIQEAGKDFLSLETEVLFQDPVVVKATVQTQKGYFTGISAANPLKTMEKQSPYEVAETSAVGRALGFAGYGSIESISSAEEITYASKGGLAKEVPDTCEYHPNVPMFKGPKTGKWGHMIDGEPCFGSGTRSEKDAWNKRKAMKALVQDTVTTEVL